MQFKIRLIHSAVCRFHIQTGNVEPRLPGHVAARGNILLVELGASLLAVWPVILGRVGRNGALRYVDLRGQDDGT